MLEADWLTCEQPLRMLLYLRGRLSARKLRLFAVACCRRLGHLLPDERSRRAVAVAEAYADAPLLLADLAAQARAEARAVAESYEGDYFASWSRAASRRSAAGYWAARAAEDALGPDAAAAAVRASASAHHAEDEPGGSHLVLDPLFPHGPTFAAQARLLHDLVGNPYRPTRALPRGWRTPTVLGLARRAYEDRDGAVLPILADALEDAGCTDNELLRHCRDPGEHLRGCWAVDAVLAKE